MEIGIFGRPEDDQVKILKKRIKQKGKKPVVINFRDFPTNVKMYFTEKEIVLHGKNLLDMHSFYIRQLGYFWPVPHIKMNKSEWIKYHNKYQELLINERENISFKHSMIRMLNFEKPVINPYDSFFYHRVKPYQFYLFYKNGLPVPSFVTGSNSSIKDVFDISDMVYKPIAGGAEVVMANDFLKKNEDIVKKRSVVYQDYIKGDNVRMFATEDGVIGAAKLICGPQVDSRVEPADLEVVNLPDDVIEIGLKAMSLLGMKFSGIDFIVTKDDEYFILECNPSPMFYVFEEISKIKVSEKLTEYLISVKK